MSVREERIQLGGLEAIAVGDPDAPVVMVLSHGFQMEPADLSPFAHSMRAPAWFLFPEAPKPAEPRGRAWWFIDAKLRDEALERGPRDFAIQHPPDLPAGAHHAAGVPRGGQGAGRRRARSSSAASRRAACSPATRCLRSGLGVERHGALVGVAHRV